MYWKSAGKVPGKYPKSTILGMYRESTYRESGGKVPVLYQESNMNVLIKFLESNGNTTGKDFKIALLVQSYSEGLRYQQSYPV